MISKIKNKNYAKYMCDRKDVYKRQKFKYIEEL